MSFDGRVRILCDGPMTVVVGWKATPAERASAYPVFRALDFTERLRREAELGGARHVLVDVVELIFDPGGIGFRRIQTSAIAERVLKAVRAGELLVIPGWDGMGRTPATPGRWDATVHPNRGVPDSPQAAVLAVLGTHQNGVFVVDGRRYRVVAGEAPGATARVGSTDHEVVAPAEAAVLLQKMADQILGAPAVVAALKEASRLVGEPGPDRAGRSGAGLSLLREARRGGVAPQPPKPAPSSRTRAPADDAEPDIRLVSVEAPTFVPGAETMKIAYAIDGPVAKAASVKMIVRSVPAKGTRSIVDTVPLDGPYEPSGSVDWDGGAGAPAGCVTLRGSPYEVTFELTSKSGKVSTSNAAKIRLEIKETKIIVDDAGPLDVPANWKPAVDAFIAELKHSGMPGDCEGRVIIDSPLFKTNDGRTPWGDMYSDVAFTSYQAKAHLGPRLPFLVQVKLKAKDGTGKRSGAALVGTRVLWDFKLETLGELDAALAARGVQPTAKAFLKKVGGYEEIATQPKGASAHLKVGGLRAKSADRAAAGTQWLPGADWNLTAPAKRDWAAFTTCGSSAFGAVADSGTYFHAGRMAGDTFKVRAVVDVDETFDVMDEAAPDGAPAVHRSNIVKITIWRRVPIVGDWIVGAKTAPVPIPPLTAEYKRAGMLIEPAPGVVPTDVEATWVNAYRAEVDHYVSTREPFFYQALERDPAGYAVRYRDFIDYWKLANPDAGFFGTLWERIKTFFGGADEQGYKIKCDKAWTAVIEGITKRIPIPDHGITALKFGTQGPHNKNPNSDYVAGMAPAIAGVTSRTQAIFYQFTLGADTETFIHEVGHSLFLAHAPGHYHPPDQPDGYDPAAHDKDQICSMSYHPEAKHLCGKCLLKLGGRNYQRIKNDGTLLP